MKDKIKLSINFNSASPFAIGQKSEAEIVLVSSQNLEIDYLDYSFIIEARGLTRTKKLQINRQTLAKQLTLFAGQRYSYPIEILNSKYETYKGRNIEVLGKLEANLKLKDEKTMDHLISNLGFTPSGKKLTVSEFIQFEQLNSVNRVETRKSELDFQSIFRQGAVIFFVILVWFFFLTIEEIAQYVKIAGTVIGLLLAVAGIGYVIIGIRIIGTIKAEFKDLQDKGFQVILSSSEHWNKVNRIEVNYKVVEEVVDDRGTSETKERSILYNSGNKIIERPKKNISIDFDYPENYIPEISYEKVRIFWLLEVKTYLFGSIAYRFKKELAMLKE